MLIFKNPSTKLVEGKARNSHFMQEANEREKALWFPQTQTARVLC